MSAATEPEHAQAAPDGARSIRPPRLKLALRLADWWSPDRRPAVALVLILLVAATLRLVGLSWDENHKLHPDERFITMVAERIRIPSSVDQNFDTARSPLNPYNNDFGSYIYGTFPLFVVRALAEMIQSVARAAPVPEGGPITELFGHFRLMAGYGEITYLGRFVSALADLATIFLIFLIGRRLYGVAVGLLAALLASFTALQIQAAHFFTAESPLALVTTLAFYVAIRTSQSGSLPAWALLGVVSGLAVATRVTAIMFGAVVLGAAWLYWERTHRLPAEDEQRRFALEDVLTGLVITGALAFVTFRVAQPYAFAGPGLFDITPNPKYVADLQTWQRFATGEADYPPSHQWTSTTPYVWQLTNMTLWGMGPPLAIAAWLGFLLAAVQFLRDRGRYGVHVLGLIWVGLNFAYWGPQFVKPMRYLLPIYPQLAIFAAYFVVSAWQWARREDWPAQLARWRPSARLRRAIAAGLLAAVAGWTVFYGLAFTSIYTRTTTRVAASEWLYDNAAPGSRIGVEHWDDPLPLRTKGRDAFSIYKGVEFPMYDPDTPEKRAKLIERLNEADYLVLSSNRLYGSIPKLPQRYPMTVRYYQALFSGELGFEKAAEFISRPSLFGIELNDDNAEEIFTVYEHPKVTIFRKSPSYSPAQVQAVLGSVSLDNVLKGLRPVQVKTSGLLLNPQEASDARSGGTWSQMFDRDSLANAAPLLVWYLVVQVLGLLALPMTWLVGRRLGDLGYPLARIVALLVIAYLPWLLASLHLLPYSQISIALSVLAMAGASLLVWVRRYPELLHDLSARWRPIVATEAAFLLVFLGFTAIRAANPDLWHSAYGGEKPMDYAYLNAVIKSTWFPPYDPWLAGGYINYYYFGQVIVASLTKLTGVVPWVAYNLAIPTIAALTATGVMSAVYNLLIAHDAPARRQLWAIGGGAGAAGLAVVAGNLHGVVQIVEYFTKMSRSPAQSVVPGLGGAQALVGGLWAWLTAPTGSRPPLSFNFWDPTRVIVTDQPAAITEFPFFTFLYGDLHAHMIAMPLGLLVIGLAINLLRQPAWIPELRGRPGDTAAVALARAAVSPAGLSLLAAALTIGVIRMTNSWDYPTYIGVVGLAILIAEAARPNGSWVGAIVRAAVLAALVLLASQVFVAPFLARYELFYTGVELSRFRTLAPHYLTIMGAFLAVLAVYLAFQLSALRQRLAAGAIGALGLFSGTGQVQSITAAPALRLVPGLDQAAVAVGALAVFLALLFLVAGIPVVGIAGLGLGALAVVAALRRPAAPTLFVLGLAATALAITAGVELVTLKGDIGRMNTVFKFYLQAWFFLSIVSGVIAVPLLRRAWASRWLLPGWRRIVAGAVALVVAATLIYPLLGTPSKLQHRFVHLPASLDGMAFMSQAKYEDKDRDLRLPDDFAAINWMLDNIQGSPVVVEGLSPLYHWRSRVSIYTGLPAVIGWDWHQKQQRGDFGFMVDERVKDVETIYNSTRYAEARQLLDKYGVEYVYVGGQERAFYPGPGLDKFDSEVGRSLQRVYQGGAVTIYRVVR